MFATGADPESERTLPRESQAWRLVRRTIPVGKSISAIGYLISVGLIASWIIAVFFGASLFFLMPRPATMVTGSSAAGDRFNASSAEIPWLFQSTDRLHQLSAPMNFESGQPAGGTGMINDGSIVGVESRNAVEANQKPTSAEPIDTGTIDEPHNEAPSVSAASGELPSAPPPEDRAAAAGLPIPLHAPQSQPETPRQKHIPKITTNKAPSAHPPLQAIQDVLQKHAGLLK